MVQHFTTPKTGRSAFGLDGGQTWPIREKSFSPKIFFSLKRNFFHKKKKYIYIYIYIFSLRYSSSQFHTFISVHLIFAYLYLQIIYRLLIVNSSITSSRCIFNTSSIITQSLALFELLNSPGKDNFQRNNRRIKHMC